MSFRTLLTPLTKGKVPQQIRSMPHKYRYSWAYQDRQGQYFLGTFRAIDIPAHPTDMLYVLEAGDVARPDLIAYKLYKSPKLYWVILWINNISDPFEGMYPGMLLRVPTLQRLAEYGILE